MKNSELLKIIWALKNGEIIAYPAESVFSLGCDPDNDKTIQKLLTLKNRSWEKGFILVSDNYDKLTKYIDDKKLTKFQKRIISFHDTFFPRTWVVPAKKCVSKLITGQFKSIAIRISRFEYIKNICLNYGKPIISTSANISNDAPCRTKNEVAKKFNQCVRTMNGKTLGNFQHSIVQDLLNGYLYRKR
ncbi:L-threonylcarbamoyladenylate synthase type 1 TsaC [Candidatus Riesia pediculicola]|uniref:Threonylcarbamoyl-AMP synthase n=1 Tax=Riesia pediculicola (strain USDA) TaxID=515618 RepID=TSAC_RIEPU|nr:L-threonylcarbamoyladenylate synthase type 1 TsaC [Candidatus Riesia pediculicola]D4G8K6.1 RecName: Full=Threonylcarbamoyl-AMP synthase; Short=TC-AMP synthase; AltName: Full=L-threonylcarbamoyladenylate synthase; AltName: Full=t(6)A37 threonylcarbamoyladenosine biosynthesis protein TsaC; AltName: Full=tRNA threonylcarbamoyladenosine biosynthesis protein TsaC [Candidatus Riesia pediculicola USDA]ADD79703.1 protein YrdC [Candidatus Riesia pediculicola USDA]ARC53884.1 tRNA(ANN) t(6)A37 threonylc